MSIEVHGIKDQETWLKLRSRDITASDIGAIMGLHPTRSPLTVYAEKLGAFKRQDSNIMRRGRWMEGAFIEAFKDERPDLVLHKCQQYYRDSKLRIGATPDFFAYPADRGMGHTVVETKIVAWPEFRKKWLTVKDEDSAETSDGDIVPPLHFELQALVQAKLTNAAHAMVAPLAIDAYRADLFQCPVSINDNAWEAIKECVSAFWKNFEKGRPPAITPALDKEAINALFAEAEDKAIDLAGDNHVRSLMVTWQEKQHILSEHKDEIKGAERRIEEIKTELKSIMGSATLARLPGFEISWKAQTRKPQPETTIRVMRIKETKERNYE